jgi:hypothetical protein
MPAGFLNLRVNTHVRVLAEQSTAVVQLKKK